MKKKVLSEVSLYYGKVSMPKGFEIDRSVLATKILNQSFKNLTDSSVNFPFSKPWDMLNTYIRDFIKVEHNLNLINKSTWGNIYKPNETTYPLLNIDQLNLRNSPDYVLLYGVGVQACTVRIHYDDNRRKGRSWNIELKNNEFIMFPSTCMYYLTNKQQDILNFVQTITYEYI